MLATMRPAQLHPNPQVGHSRNVSRNSNNNGSAPNSAAPSRPSSVKLSRSNSNRSNTSNGEKHSNISGNAKVAKATSKKAPTSALVNEVQPVTQNTPGLITLSRPLGESSNKKARATDTAVDPAAKTSRPQRKKKAAAIDEASLLSSSAPAAQGNGKSEWSMPVHRVEDEEPLTWQQQLINSTTSSTTPEKKKSTKKGANKKAAANIASATEISATAKESLTWQQELLGSNKPRGPTFDVFADARDEATFGGGSANERQGAEGQSRGNRKKQQQPQVGGRKRADSAGESRLRSLVKSKSMAAGLPSAPQAPISDLHKSGSFAGAINSKAPSTPDSKLAYAGPNFHNSPSAASLPVPKFLQQRTGSSGSGDIISKPPSSPFARDAIIRNAVKGGGGGSGVSNDGDNSNSSEEDNDDLKRSTRGATAPPELQQSQVNGQDRRSMTIQSLMAKLMMPGSD